jgi:macrodomain Ter protein organizer (MatP/YcbG family)
MAKDTKNINIEVHQDIWKKLKILSVHKDLTLQDVVRDILEKSVSSKKLETLVPDIN